MFPFRVERLRAWPPPAMTAVVIALLLLVRVVQTVDDERRQPEIERLQKQVNELWTAHPHLVPTAYVTATATRAEHRSESDVEAARLQQELFEVDQRIAKLMLDRAEWRWGIVADEPVHAGTLFGHFFVHIGWLHLFANLWFFWIAAMGVERRCKWYGFVAVFVAGAFGSVLVHGWLIDGGLRHEPLVGASGTVMAFVGALVATGPVARIVWLTPIGRTVGTPAWSLLPLFGALELVAHWQGAGAATLAHGGGLATGLVVGAVLRFTVLRPRRE